MQRLCLWCTAILLLSSHAWAQSDPTITSAVVPNARQVMVVFSVDLTTNASGPQFAESRVRLLPDNITPIEISQNSLAHNTFTLNFTAVPETATRVCFDRVEFGPAGKVSTSAAQVCADLSRDPAALKETWIKAFREVPRSSRDKDIFASGFVTAAPDDSAGGADLSLNPKFNIPNLTAFLVVKKATAEEGDSKHFESGGRYRFTRTWKPAQMQAIAAESDPVKLNELIRARQRNVLAGWLVDVAGKLEGDPTNFDVTNVVGESSLHLQTMTKGFLGKRGFWRGFVVPAGIEAGQSIGTTAPAEAETSGEPAEPVVNRIARYKGGAGLAVYFDNPTTQLGVRRVEVDVNAVLRHLFLTESRFNEETKKTDTTDDGIHPYGQIDLKLFLGESDAGLFGVKLSYNRGRLPPVYSEVKSFSFGFVIESRDDNAKAAAERKTRQ